MSPLANQDPLAQLNDIIAPTAPNWFPPAPIYWFLLVTIITIVGVAYSVFTKYQKQQARQKLLLNKLAQLQEQQVDFITLNQLIKATTLLYFPRDKVASLHGEHWFYFLQKYSASPIFKDKQSFIERLYSQNLSGCSEEDFSHARKWIVDLPKQIKKQGEKNV